jgi:CubicO group peptidase (beta-lactamase class C family)
VLGRSVPGATVVPTGDPGGTMAEVQGTCDGRFERVREALAGYLDEGLDVGASAAVVVSGEPVVDIWGGWTDETRSTPWEQDTIVNVWSTTKTMTALSALVLADRGELDLDARAAHYWPEFAAGGKDGVLVRHLLGHTAGLPGWAEPMKVEDLYDWERATSLLAAQEPWWEPGTACGYHAVTQGYLVGEVVRRLTGQSLGTFFAKELAGPLGADFHIGVAPEHDERVARVIPPPPIDLGSADPDGIAVRTLANPRLTAEEATTEAWRRAEIPAANGHGNARSVAAVQAALANGGEVGGVRLLSPTGAEAALREQARGTDLVLGVPMRLGMGYGLNSPELPVGPNPRTCFWGGWGGSLVVVDLDARMVVAYVMNRMGEGTLGDVRGAGVVAAAYTGLAEG